MESMEFFAGEAGKHSQQAAGIETQLYSALFGILGNRSSYLEFLGCSKSPKDLERSVSQVIPRAKMSGNQSHRTLREKQEPCKTAAVFAAFRQHSIPT